MAKVHFVNSKVLQAGDGVGGDDLSQYATIAYSDAEDDKIRASLEEVQSEGRTNTYEVQPTLNAASVGQCVFSNPNGAYTNQGSIQFSATDLSGHSIHWALIKPGNSFIITELNSDDYAVGEVQSVNSQTNTVQVRIFEGEGNPLQGDILHFAGSPFAARNDSENDYLTQTEGDAKYATISHQHNNYASNTHDHTPRYAGRFDKTMTFKNNFGSLSGGQFGMGKPDYSTSTTYIKEARFLKAYGNGFPSATSKHYTGGGIISVHTTSDTNNSPLAVFQVMGGGESKNGDNTFRVYPIANTVDYLNDNTSLRLVFSGVWWDSRGVAPQIASTEQALRDQLIGTDPAKIEELVEGWIALKQEGVEYVN